MSVKKPKFKVGQHVVYHAGNWKYDITKVLFDPETNGYVYMCFCQEDPDLCEICTMIIENNECEDVVKIDEELHKQLFREDELMDYDEWCDHTEDENGDYKHCDICC